MTGHSLAGRARHSVTEQPEKAAELYISSRLLNSTVLRACSSWSSWADSEAGPVGAPGQCGRRGAEAHWQQVTYRPWHHVNAPTSESTRYPYIVILQTHRGRCRAFLYMISVYCDIVCNIGSISGPISVKNTISAMATNGMYTICTRYRARYREKTRYRARYWKYRVWRLTVCTRYVHDIGPDIANIGPDIVNFDTISWHHDTISWNFNIGSHSDIGWSDIPISDTISWHYVCNNYIYIYFLNKISVKIIVIIISELSLDGWESWENIPVKFSNVNYPQTKDNNAPQNFFVAIFCCSCGFGKAYLLTKL